MKLISKVKSIFSKGNKIELVPANIFEPKKGAKYFMILPQDSLTLEDVEAAMGRFKEIYGAEIPLTLIINGNPKDVKFVKADGKRGKHETK